MILLPDYPDQVIRNHRMRVEKIALSATFLLILSASWWLLSALFGESDLLPRLVPICLIFHHFFDNYRFNRLWANTTFKNRSDGEYFLPQFTRTFYI